MPKHNIIENLTAQSIIATKAEIATSVYMRTKGLLGRDELREGSALIIPRCSIVHMFFMRFPIDVIFCSKKNIILSFQENLKPWRVSKWVFRASFVIELPVGAIKKSDSKIGDLLNI